MIIETKEKNIFTKDYYYGCKRSNYFNYECWDNNLYWNPIIKRLKKLNTGGRILDIGCAFGYLLKRVKPLFEEVYGIDISQFAINKAKTILPEADLQVLDLDNGALPYPDQYFDVITALDVLEHTQSIKKSLEKIIPKIKKNGYLLISIPIKDTLASKIVGLFNRDISHISVPTRRELTSLMADLKLKVIEKSFFWGATWFRFPGLSVDYQLILQKS